MTIKQYIKKYGWNLECKSKICWAMNVNIGFSNEGQDDETQFSIEAYDVDELNNLFADFCKENGFKQNTVTYITIVEMADSIEDLS